MITLTHVADPKIIVLCMWSVAVVPRSSIPISKLVSLAVSAIPKSSSNSGGILRMQGIEFFRHALTTSFNLSRRKKASVTRCWNTCLSNITWIYICRPSCINVLRTCLIGIHFGSSWNLSLIASRSDMNYSVAICSHFHRVAFVFHLQYSSTCRVLIASARKPLFDLWQWWVCGTISAISCLQWLCSLAFASKWSIQWIHQTWEAWHLAPQGHSFLDKMD